MSSHAEKQLSWKDGRSAADKSESIRSFEDFREGDVLISPSTIVDQERIDRFAEVSGDFNPIHMDPAFARKTMWRGVVAHGMLVASIATGMAYQCGLFGENTLALEGSKEEFLQPVRPGDEVYATVVIKKMDAEASKRCGRIEWDLKIYKRKPEQEEDDLVMRGEWRVLIFKEAALKRLMSRT